MDESRKTKGKGGMLPCQRKVLEGERIHELVPGEVDHDFACLHDYDEGQSVLLLCNDAGIDDRELYYIAGIAFGIHCATKCPVYEQRKAEYKAQCSADSDESANS